MTEISKLGEFGLIDRLTQPFTLSQTSSLRGIGDDAAVLQYADQTVVVSTDLLIEGIHFDLAYTPLKHLGYKCVAVNVSDIYAMNARPAQVTLAMGVSNRFSVEALEELYEGVRLACQYYGVDLVGGDTTSSNKGLILCLTAIGGAAPERLAYRSGARVGDLICASGDFGGAYMGLQLLEREKQIYLENPKMQPDLEGKAYIVGRLLKPEARKDVFELLEKLQIVPTSMIDVSDGLSSELLHLCRQSATGALIEEASIRIHPETYQQSIAFGIDPLTSALHGGEDYELLFTIAPQDAAKLRYQMDINIIGEMMPAQDGILLHSKGGRLHPLKAQGWVHH